MQDTAVAENDDQGSLEELPEEYAWLEGGQSYVCLLYTSPSPRDA